MSDVATNEAQIELMRIKGQLLAATTDLVLLQSELALLGVQMVREEDSRADSVLRASQSCGKIWEMLR